MTGRAVHRRLRLSITLEGGSGASSLAASVTKMEDGWHVWDLTHAPDADAIEATTWSGVAEAGADAPRRNPPFDGARVPEPA